MMNRFTLAGLSLLWLVVALAACALPGQKKTPEILGPEAAVNTAAAKTVSAMATGLAEGKNPTLGNPPASATPIPPQTAIPAGIPSATPEPVISSTPAYPDAPCNRAEFISDTTIPDGSVLLPNSVFTKTWELKNTGSCAWDSSYSVFFTGQGNSLSGPGSLPILASGQVHPGETLQISVPLRAPAETGEFKGYWMLRAGDGNAFGTGEKGGSPFYVQIQVAEEFAFAAQMCMAQWSTAGGPLPCPGKETDPAGAVLLLENPTLEDNQQREGRGVLAAPQPIANGYIVGRFPPVVVPDQADFRATLGCAPGASGCYLRFKVTYQVDNGPEQVLGEWNEGADNNVTNAVKDLDVVAGKSTAFNFYIYVAGSPDQSRGIWFNPRIVK